MSLTDTLANAIATMEGFFVPNSLAQRNNNPGNLRAGVGQIGTDSNGFAIFSTAADGWNALYNQISLDAGRGLDLSQFIAKYAPPSENNTSNYLDYVTASLGVAADTALSDLGTGSPGNPPTAPLHTRLARERTRRPAEPAD